MTPTSDVSVSAARWLVGVIAGVVLCFAITTIVGDHLDSAIAARANRIVTKTMPSLRAVTAARGDLWQLEMSLDRYDEVPAARRPQLRDQIAATRRAIDADLVAYIRRPFVANELYQLLHARLAGLDKRIATYVARPEPVALESARGDFDIVDDALERIEAFHAEQGQRLGLEIERIRAETRTTVAVLEMASLALAIVAVYLALRQLRRAAGAHSREREARERRETELAKQNEALGQFAGRVAHDVLSPLTTASLALELVRHKSGLDPPALRATDRGLAAISSVQTLVEGLLSFARAGGRPEPGASTEIGPVIADAVDQLSGRAKQEHIELTVRLPQKGELACSKAVLTSVVSNLLVNAIKYIGDATDRRIELRAIDVHDRWRIEVEDTGPGIPADQQQRIFQPYVQLGAGAAGIGLGLAIVERLVRAHAGALGVISPPKGGSLFWFELPKPIVAPLDRAVT
jgi:signal transduction histidine kinase